MSADTPSRVSPSATETKDLTGREIHVRGVAADEELLRTLRQEIRSSGESDEVRLFSPFAGLVADALDRWLPRLPPRSPSSPVPSSEARIGGIRIGGICWLLIRDGLVLMERCPNKAKKLGVGEWFIPGGKVELGETLFEALIRELGEEWPGVTLETFRALPIVEGSPLTGTFLMRPWVIAVSGEIPQRSGDDVELRWTPIAEALASPVPQVRMMVAAAVESRPPSRGTEPEDFEKLLDALEKATGNLEYNPYDDDYIAAGRTARAAIRGYVSRLTEENERIRGEASGWQDIAEHAERELSRIQQTGLTPDEAGEIVHCFEHIFKHTPEEGCDCLKCSFIPKLRSLAALRSLEGDRGK